MKLAPKSGRVARIEENRPVYRQQISQEDWERTPSSVKKLLEEMAERLEQIEEELAQVQAQQQLLKEKTNRTSSNSSQAPSSDPAGAAKSKRKRKSGKKRGGQPPPGRLPLGLAYHFLWFNYLKNAVIVK